jgi:lipoate-protein ligase A
MHFLDLTLPTLAENLALDEALLLDAEAGSGGEVLRVWEWPTPAVVLGAGDRLAQEVDEGACQSDGIPIFRRASGGGAVLLGQGCLCYSLVLGYNGSPDRRDVRDSFAYILGRIRDSLIDLAPKVELAGTSDLAVQGRKFSGNSQERKGHFLLHHGTFLYSFNIDLVRRYLRMPSRQPGYRRQRSHLEFMANLPAKPNELIDRLKEAWGAERQMYGWPREKVRELVENKYAKPEWTRRR